MPRLNNAALQQMVEELKAEVRQLTDIVLAETPDLPVQTAGTPGQVFNQPLPFVCPKCAIKLERQRAKTKISEETFQQALEFINLVWTYVQVSEQGSQWWSRVEGHCKACESLYMVSLPYIDARSRTHERMGLAIPVLNVPELEDEHERAAS